MTTNKVAIVTGGGTGLGLGAARTLAREGYAVAILGRRLEPLQKAAGGALHAFACDVADKGEVDRAVTAVLNRFGRLDLLVNNAGVFRIKKLAEVTPAHIAEVFGANMFGTIHMTLACMAALKASRGAIVNVSSSIAHHPSDRGVSIYGATKGGIEVFTRICARELAPEVRVNCVSPGLMRSDAYIAQGTSQAEYDALLEKWAQQFPVKRTGEPEDFGELVAFLADPRKSGWMTGTIHILDGGRSLL
jgi:NAD(P)-dependent dehydrogenase (short-subunit alcohol dehydrogenase family)